ncbi:MAG TPA: hypothetical protein VHD38_00930 [Candidatus Paceibacterota bacterium]|jgi:hypothetical protein|nr:hypothetical protein [Candidatus Paceibacterota bacterium]
MKKLFAVISLITLTAPVFAAADSVRDAEEQVMFMLGRTAAIQAFASGTQVACGLVTSKAVVRVGEPYELIWNTYGAQDPSDNGPSQFAPRGILTVTMQKSGVFTYKIPFFGVNGGQATCFAKITILP